MLATKPSAVLASKGKPVPIDERVAIRQQLLAMILRNEVKRRRLK